jgi:hypothetical protein
MMPKSVAPLNVQLIAATQVNRNARMASLDIDCHQSYDGEE